MGNPLHKDPSVGIKQLHGDEDSQTKKIVLCFDGTSNSFQGDESDTNVVKVFQMLNRKDKHQYHYYQPGIGTYQANSALQNTTSTGFLAGLYSNFRAKMDEAFASSFAEHVMAGYKFLMRYCMEGDKIYIFGFSRGAYTARFLCELIDHVGLLSKGNEEMVPFIWYRYVEWRAKSNGGELDPKLKLMSQTFCRRSIKVYFLGLWDCVASVAQFSSSKRAPLIEQADPNIAEHVRHAVSSHERRVMFRPALFTEKLNTRGTFQEMWFAGNHGDIGGGWSYNKELSMLLSDHALVWMVSELQKVEMNDEEERQDLRLSWCEPGESEILPPEYTFTERKKKLENCMQQLEQRAMQKPEALEHDMLNPSKNRPGLGKWPKLFMWWLMEILPLKHTILVIKHDENFKRLIHDQNGQTQTIHRREAKAVPQTTHRPNAGRRRNIPLEAVFHDSVRKLHEARVIKSMAKWEFGPVGYTALVKAETMSKGHANPSLEHDRYMFIG